MYFGFFDSNPSLDEKNRLRVTIWMGDTLGTARYLRVHAVETEGRPGDSMLWIAYLEEVTSRKDT